MKTWEIHSRKELSRGEREKLDVKKNLQLLLGLTQKLNKKKNKLKEKKLFVESERLIQKN